jgi:endoglucanase
VADPARGHAYGVANRFRGAQGGQPTLVKHRSWITVALAVLLIPIAPAATSAYAAGTGYAPVTKPYRPNTGPRVRVNQVGYLPDGPKDATVVTTAVNPVRWQLRDAAGAVVTSGDSVPHGFDPSSGQKVHSIDFSGYRTPGTGYTLAADGDTSYPFQLGTAPYDRLSVDALKFFYPQRSGIRIENRLRPGYGRKAGHLSRRTGDARVSCLPHTCGYRLDVKGGWYDAGDQGKYVVNGGIAVHQLMSEFERTRYARTAQPGRLGDGTLAIPESGNRVPDVLDEARWEMTFLLRMQVPPGHRLAGMAHHKVQDRGWTGLPTLPAKDKRKRVLYPPSTAATLNLAATAAQAARVFAPYDPAFTARNLAAARTAYAAAQAHPRSYASDDASKGGGAYSDRDVSDEFYWAAAELYLTTGEQRYADAVLASPYQSATAQLISTQPASAFGWSQTAQLGRLDLATVPNNLPHRDELRNAVQRSADGYLATLLTQPYGLPYAPVGNRYEWGSNSEVLNNIVVMATAYDLGGDTKYRDGALEGLDYLLGRNALNRSYVSGYGEVSARNQHSRWYAHQIDRKLPHPPPGTLAGGPNSALQDSVSRSKVKGCAPQLCYVDDIKAWSTNELAINWNSALAWVASFAADQGHGSV